MKSDSLPNGIRVLAINLPESTDVSIFTFLPLGLTSDEAGRAQWSHLVEHMVIRSTIPATSMEANAETLPDHMRLDFYGRADNWKEGLEHHRRWLQGLPFTEEILEAEKPKVNSECDFTVRALATHKFAIAAWSQGLRHNRNHIALKGDVEDARLPELQRYRDQRLAVRNKVIVCVVGGLPPQEVIGKVKKKLGGLELSGFLPESKKITNRDLKLTWDLNARHLLLTWAIPGVTSKDYAALMVGAQALNIAIFSDDELKRLTGMTLAGCDLATPEGNYFFVSASLRPGTPSEEVRARLDALMNNLSIDATIPAIAHQLGASLTTFPDLEMMNRVAPDKAALAKMLGNWGIQLGMAEYRFGDRRTSLALELATMTEKQMHAVIQRHLLKVKPATCVLEPKAEIGPHAQ